MRKVRSGLRYYSPTTGRWLNRDPIGELGGINQYVFAANQPLGAMDHLGLFTAVFGEQVWIEEFWHESFLPWGLGDRLQGLAFYAYSGNCDDDTGELTLSHRDEGYGVIPEASLISWAAGLQVTVVKTDSSMTIVSPGQATLLLQAQADTYESGVEYMWEVFRDAMLGGLTGLPGGVTGFAWAGIGSGVIGTFLEEQDKIVSTFKVEIDVKCVCVDDGWWIPIYTPGTPQHSSSHKRYNWKTVIANEPAGFFSYP